MAAQASHAALSGEGPRGQVGEWAVVPVGEDLLDDGVVAVVLLGLDHLERAVGEHGVVTPGGKQFLLPVPSAGVHVADAADDQPGRERNRRRARTRVCGERGVFHLGDLGVEIQQPQLVIPQRTTGRRSASTVVAGMAAIAAWTEAFSWAVTEKYAFPAWRAACSAAEL